MTDRFYGINQGDVLVDVIEGDVSMAISDVEIRVDLDASLSKAETLKNVQILYNRIAGAKTWPPA